MEEEGESAEEQQEERIEPQESLRTRVGFPEVKQEPSISKKALVIPIILVLIVGIAGWRFFSSRKNSSPTSEASPTPFVSEETPTPTPINEVVDKSLVKIQVLNASGIPGAAASLSDKLKQLGYEKIELGNADSQDKKETEVSFNEDVAASVKEEILAKLKEIYQDVDSYTKSLKAFDVQITTGFPKGYTPTPTQKPKVTSSPTPTSKLTGTPTATPSATSTLTPSPTP